MVPLPRTPNLGMLKCLCVCVYVYVCLCVWVYAPTQTRIHARRCMHAILFIRICVNTHCIYVCVRACENICVCVYECVCMYMGVCQQRTPHMIIWLLIWVRVVDNRLRYAYLCIGVLSTYIYSRTFYYLWNLQAYVQCTHTYIHTYIRRTRGANSIIDIVRIVLFTWLQYTYTHTIVICWVRDQING